MFYSIEEIKNNGISLHQYLNFILVSNNARKAYLADHGDANTYHLLMPMSNELIASESYFGVVISKEKYTHVDEDVLSEILEFNEKMIEPEKPRGIVNINVILNNGETEQLIVFICRKDYDISILDERVERYKNTLLTNEYTKNYVVDVKAYFRTEYTISECIDAIINNNVNENINDEIQNYLFNHFNSSDDELDILKYIDLKNEFHKGIIVALLLSFKHDICEQFYPLNQHQDKQCSDVQEKLFNELVLLLKKN